MYLVVGQTVARASVVSLFFLGVFSLLRSRDEVHVHREEFGGYLESNRPVAWPRAALSIRSVDVCTSRAISTK